MWVLGMMYENTENLRRLDQVLVTNREYDQVLAWKFRLHSKTPLKTLKPQRVKKAPEVAKDDDDKKAGGA